MAGLVPAIHDFLMRITKTWMPATSAGMTEFGVAPLVFQAAPSVLPIQPTTSSAVSLSRPV